MRINTLTKTTLICASLTVLILSSVFGGGTQEEEQVRSGDRIELGNAAGNQEIERQDEPEQATTPEQPDASRQSGRPSWALVDHPLEQDVVSNISGIIADGYVPVGMELGEEGVSMLYASSTDVIFERWMIHEFTELENLNNEMSAVIMDGWTPMDMSLSDAGLSVLFVNNASGEEILGWRIHEISAAEPEEVLNVLEEYRDEGYLPYGITLDRQDDEFWFLLLQIDRPDDTELRRIALNGFTNEELENGINTDVRNKLLPWGLARGNQGSFVLYLF